MANQQEPSELGKRIAALCEQHHIVSLYVFGSQARSLYESVSSGAAPALSTGHDVDIGVRLQPEYQITTRQKVELTQKLESLIGAERVDLVFLDEVDPFLAANVIRGERLYTAHSHASDEYELYVLRRAGDLAPYERERIRLILKDESP